METVTTTVAQVVIGAVSGFGSYLPQFLGGLIVLLTGLVVATLLKEVVLRSFRLLKVESWFSGLGRWLKGTTDSELKGTTVWSNLLAELVRWAVVILFLVPAVEAWGLPRVTDVLNQVLLFLPNIFVAVVVGFVGFGIANLVFDLVRSATEELGSTSSLVLANVARYALVFFTTLVVLNQLGVASELVRILFTGIVAMVAIAGGVAFGLGGQESAKRVLRELEGRFDERLERADEGFSVVRTLPATRTKAGRGRRRSRR